MDQNKELVKLVKRNTHFEFLSNGKIRCLLTGHELAPSVSEYNIYLESKGYKNAQDKDFDFSQFAPHILDHKSDSKKLFCTLTKQVLSKKKITILNHVNGKRYKKVLQMMLSGEQEQDVANDDDQVDIEEDVVEAQVEEVKQEKKIVKKDQKKEQKKELKKGDGVKKSIIKKVIKKSKINK